MPQAALRIVVSGVFIASLTVAALAQTTPVASPPRADAATVANDAGKAGLENRAMVERETTDDVRAQLREQREEIQRLQSALREQMRLIEDLRARIGRAEERAEESSAARPAEVQRAVFNDALPPAGAPLRATTESSVASQNPASQNASGASQPKQQPGEASLSERLGRAEEQARKTSEALSKQLGSITFSGDLRLRYESLYGQLNAQPTSDNPAALGNPLSTRQRFRLRARLAMRGHIGREFDWGLRFATGTFPDVISTNQTLTDFFSHKNFALDQAYISYRPARVPGLQLQGGKFDAPWLRTEMTLDNDVNPEGFNESYTRDFKNSAFKNLTLVAWQLPMLERASAFVLGSDGRVSLDQSGRAGRDLALYGAQARVRLAPSAKVALTLSAADLYYSGTQFITPAQFFGPNVQIPVVVNIPATSTSPAQTVTAQVSIPREQLVSGNVNLGIASATNNAVNRDGRLSSGFNMVDLIGRLDLSHSSRFPAMLLFNFVTNTQAHMVVTASAVQSNHENNGYWAELQIGKTQKRGDWLFNYTFMRIEKDAVLTGFNYSDLAQQSDIRAQRFIIAYAADPRVTLSVTGIVTERPNGLLGVFGTTPPGSLNRATTRLQLDTVFRF